MTLNHAYPEFRIDANRLISFEDWPKGLKQKPSELAEAGFFYSGKGDRVACFSCGGGLKDWEDVDIPWEQHALWYRDCQFLNIMKDSTFIDAVFERKNDILAIQRSIEKENKKGEEKTRGTEETLCKICFVEKYNTVFIPCKHVVACTKCSFCFLNCPYCRQSIREIVKIFLT
jgi:baculoviral IAP repeat-containing protein 7/8